MLISIILPALNEEKGIGKTLGGISYRELNEHGYQVEILVIDGESTDRTAEIAKSKGARVVKAKRGYGLQYKVGFKEANGDIIVTADADNSYCLKDINFFLKILNQEKLDFISVNRFVNMPKGAMNKTRKIGNRLLTLLTNLFFGIHLRDSQSGMWIFKKNVLDRLILTSNGMPFSEEIKIEAFRKVKSKEVPGLYIERIGTVKSRIFVDGLENLLFLVKKKLYE